jgi:exodeoxyribonuclease III
MKLATWNVNSLRVRLAHVLEWLEQTETAVLGLQETKLIDEKFPKAEIEAAGYHVVFAGQPTYNGVAILARKDLFEPPSDVVVNNPLFSDEQVRIIAATLKPCADCHAAVAARNDEASVPAAGRNDDTVTAKAPEGPVAVHPLRFISVYVPNGAAVGTDKYDYKLRWLEAFRNYLADTLSAHEYVAVGGDYNIAPEDRDVHDPDKWREQVLCSTPERNAFQALMALGFKDGFRLFTQEDKIFSWWDYRQGGFRRGFGLRIDHVLLSESLAKYATAAGIDKEPRKKEQPSDHAPAWVEC